MTLRDSISPRLLDRRPAEIGKIKIGQLGEERETRDGSGTWRMPEKLSHFRVTRRKREDGDPDENFIRDEEVHAVVGDEPTELPCRLMFDDVSANFYSALHKFRGRDRVRECDGETARDPRDGDEFPCEHPDCRCKPYGRLSVMLEASPTFGSVYVFRTTSWESIRNIQTSLELMRGQFGFLQGLPLVLKVYPATDRFEDDKGKTRTSTSFKVALELRGSFTDAARLARETRAQRLTDPTDTEALARARRDLEALDEAERGLIAEEFHPDQAPQLPAGEDQEQEGIEAAAEELPEEDTRPPGPEPEGEPEEDDAGRVAWYSALRSELSKVQADEELLASMIVAYARLRDDQPDPVPGDRPLQNMLAEDFQRAVRDLRARGEEAILEVYEEMDRQGVQTSADVGEL